MSSISRVFVKRAKWLNAEKGGNEEGTTLSDFAVQMRLTPEQVLTLVAEAEKVGLEPSDMIRKVVAGWLNS